MVFQITEASRIENPRNYGAHTVEHLRGLLIAGTDAQRDPVREHFYELQADVDSYYIHISPITGNVVLLARWVRQPVACMSETEEFAA
jgi:hypothetical protein